MKLQQKIFGIGLLTAVIVPHLYEKGYKSHKSLETPNATRLIINLVRVRMPVPKNTTPISPSNTLKK